MFLIIVVLHGLIGLPDFGILSAGSSTSQPDIPEFTLRFIDNSYDFPLTTTVDPYSGKTVTSGGYHEVNRSIEVVIENQSAPNYGAYYNVRVKGHFEDGWKILFDSREYPQSLSLKFSSTEEGLYYNSWPLSTLLYAPSGSQVDFQVKAIIGYYSQEIDNQPQMPWSTGYLTTFITQSESDWSRTQTLTIDEFVSSTTPNILPSQNSTAQNQSSTQITATQSVFSWVGIGLLTLAGIIIALLIGTLFFMRRRSRAHS
jgi:hypothetical protein